MDGPFLVNAVMFITGIFGNLSVCCVILRIPSMRSATNYYLFSLAVADLLFFFCLVRQNNDLLPKLSGIYKSSGQLSLFVQCLNGKLGPV